MADHSKQIKELQGTEQELAAEDAAVAAPARPAPDVEATPATGATGVVDIHTSAQPSVIPDGGIVPGTPAPVPDASVPTPAVNPFADIVEALQTVKDKALAKDRSDPRTSLLVKGIDDAIAAANTPHS